MLPVFLKKSYTFDDLFNDFFGGSSLVERPHSTAPKTDIMERDKDYQVLVELPGLEKEDIKLNIEKDVLSIKAERKSENKKDEKHYHYTERHQTKFERSFQLPENIDKTKIEANYKNGILELLIPKDKRKELLTEIKIN